MPYNVHNYNDQRFNINGIYHATSLVETVTQTDATQLAELLKALADSMAFSDSIIFFTDKTLSDFMFMDESIQIQFANKALSDTIRLADWLQIERNPAQNGWYD